MATRGGPDRGRGGRGAGRGGRGGPPGRGGRGGPPRGGGPTGPAPATNIAGHVEAIGVKRPGFGGQGRQLEVWTNHFETEIPQAPIHHYDVVIDQKLPAALTFEIIKTLQNVIQPNVFTPRGVYDGRKNMFSAQKWSFGNAAEFSVCLATQSSSAPPPTEGGRGPKVYKVKLTHVNVINPETLRRFLDGQQTHDNDVLTAITALNVVVRMEPSLKYPFNVRSFFTPSETRDINGGIILWRGFFQSVRPSIGRMLINVDISTGYFYKPGSLISLSLDFLNLNIRQPSTNPNALSPRNGFPDRERLRLQRFLTGIRITTKHKVKGKQGPGQPRGVKKLSRDGANNITFQGADGQTITVANYFRGVLNRPLQYPDVICVELSSGAIIPLELCDVPPGQIIKKQIPQELATAVVEFATQKPPQRLDSIKRGLGVLAYGQSEYVRQFGMNVDPNVLSVKGRVLVPPTLKYHPSSKQQTITPRDGAWNMIDKKVYKPCPAINSWAVVVYERQQRFNQQAMADMIGGFTQACSVVGISINPQPGAVLWANPQSTFIDELKKAGRMCREKSKLAPQLMVIILPEQGNTDIYHAVKHFGDVAMGVTTQCMKSSKCFRAKMQYYANVMLKLNVKMGGINTIPEPRTIPELTDPNNPTIIMGADVIHPAPGSKDRPSFTSLVGNVDSDTAKYIATIEVQEGNTEIIDDLSKMAQHILRNYMNYREQVEKKPKAQCPPRRIIFFRDGVSEGQFRHVIERELPLLKDACKALNINPKITIIVVGKRHHVRFFPKSQNEADRSGNCPAGLVVDQGITNPVEFDFYLQSHAGLLGTSRPAHYNVLYDESGFNADGLQALSFALCHVYARSTRSVSIPAPVYYADIVCSRAKHHYDPAGNLDLSGISDTATNVTGGRDPQAVVDSFKNAFKPLHPGQQQKMYFC